MSEKSETRIMVEYKIAEHNLQKEINKVISKYSIPGINYQEVWDFNIGFEELFKDFRGW